MHADTTHSPIVRRGRVCSLDALLSVWNEQAVSERESAITGRILQVKDKFLCGLEQRLPGSSEVTERAQIRRRLDLRGPAFFRGSHFYYKQGGHMAKAPSTEYPA